MTQLRVYGVLTGNSFDKIMSNFDTNKVVHSAKVSIKDKPFNFVAFNKEVFNSSTNSYLFINETDEVVYSNADLDEEEILQMYMYQLLLDNLSYYQDGKVEEFFSQEDVLTKVKNIQRRMEINHTMPNSSIKYIDDCNLIPNYPKLKFSSYLLNHEKLSDTYNLVFEQRHISYFKRLSPLKDSFKEVKKDLNGVEELREDGIFIDKLQYISFRDSLKEKEHILLTGPTGSGKSTIMFYILRKEYEEYFTIECNQSKKYTDLFGSLTLKTGEDGKQSLVPSLGKIALAYREGIPLVLEEFTALNDTNFKALLTLMQHDEMTLEIDNEQNGEMVKSITIPRHPNFFIIATANEEKRYNVETLTPQVKRRFHTIIPINYLPRDEEVAFITHRLGEKDKELNPKDVEDIVDIANTLRQKKMVVSTATLAIWAEKSTLYGLRDAAVCHFVPQIVYSKQELRNVNDALSVFFPNYEPIQLAI